MNKELTLVTVVGVGLLLIMLVKFLPQAIEYTRIYDKSFYSERDKSLTYQTPENVEKIEEDLLTIKENKLSSKQLKYFEPIKLAEFFIALSNTKERGMNYKFMFKFKEYDSDVLHIVNANTRKEMNEVLQAISADILTLTEGIPLTDLLIVNEEYRGSGNQDFYVITLDVGGV